MTSGALSMARVMVDQGLHQVFTFPGGTIAPLFDALSQVGIEIICARHEQGAGYMALAASRLTGRPQVVMVTSGPGATNLATVVADAYYDSTPLIAITGQVGTGDLFSGRQVRQLGFQQIDCLGMMAGFTKAAWQPAKAEEAAPLLRDAFALAVHGRPGPVVLDLPMDVQRNELAGPEAAPLPEQAPPIPLPAPATAAVAEAAELLLNARRPVILAGQGVLLSGATENLKLLAENFRIPVITSLPGLGAFDGASDLSLGFMGHTGNQYAALAANQADVLLVLGSRLDVRITGSETESLAAAGSIIRVDLDPGELADSRVPARLAVEADANVFLTALLEKMPQATAPDTGPWLETIHRWRQENPLAILNSETRIQPQTLVETVDRLTAGRPVVATTGVGSHQHWVARHFTFDHPRRIFLTSAGHGAMGYDLPSALGAAVARPDHLVCCFAGDGSLQINIQELQTLVDLALPVKIFVMDNARLALVSQFQLMNWPEDLTCGHKTNPDFAALATAYGLQSWRLEKPGQVESVCRQALEHDGPALVHCLIDPDADIDPMLLGGQPLSEMWTATRKA